MKTNNNAKSVPVISLNAPKDFDYCLYCSVILKTSQLQNNTYGTSVDIQEVQEIAVLDNCRNLYNKICIMSFVQIWMQFNVLTEQMQVCNAYIQAVILGLPVLY